MHPYLQLYLEVRAVKRWLTEISKDSNKADQFIREHVSSYHWGELERTVLQMPTVKEKVIYLHALGVSHAKIRERLKLSPNTIVDVIKGPPNIRHYPKKVELDALIEAWEPFKALIPKEIFIKYI